MLVVSTYRDTESASGEAPCVLRSGLLEEQLRIKLEGLTAGEARALAELRAGRALPRPVHDAIHEIAAGNPFLIDELARRIRTHPELGRRLTWFEAGSDAELDYAYRHASALIFASRCEGFGLPLVEAMQCGLPALASDIPVFREIGGDYPVYFDPDDAASLRNAIRRFELRLSAGNGMQRTARRWLSWPESARMLLEKVTGSASSRL